MIRLIQYLACNCLINLSYTDTFTNICKFLLGILKMTPKAAIFIYIRAQAFEERAGNNNKVTIVNNER